jgi:hypothetical protein
MWLKVAVEKVMNKDRQKALKKVDKKYIGRVVLSPQIAQCIWNSENPLENNDKKLRSKRNFQTATNGSLQTATNGSLQTAFKYTEINVQSQVTHKNQKEYKNRPVPNVPCNV